MRLPFGENPIGRLVYTAGGFMSAQLASAHRPAFASPAFTRATVDEKGAAYDTFMAYCGRYEVFGDHVMHHVEMSLFPNWAGGDQKRFFELDGDSLVLRPPAYERHGVTYTDELRWERGGAGGG